MTWRDRAACRDVPGDVFFPENGGTGCYDEAAAICEGCPVRSECLEDALRHPARSQYGYVGGTKPKDRRKMKAQLGDPEETCGMWACDDPVRAKGLCRVHYDRRRNERLAS